MDFGSLIIGALLGGIPSWFISKAFSEKSSKELDQKLSKQASQLGASSSFINFERMLRTSNWRKEHINHNEVWICEANNTFQIVPSDDDRPFKEIWTTKFPDQNTSIFHINLTINGTIVKSLPFISGDGGRYTLPLPELAVDDKNTPSFYWSPNSVEVKVAEIIGNFYRYSSLKEVASFTGVEFHNVSSHA